MFFVWITWFWLLITVFGDVFRRHDLSGFAKVLWLIFVIVLPFLGVFIYLIANNQGMTEQHQPSAGAAAARRIRAVCGRLRRSGHGDRQGEADVRQRHDHAERIRRHQTEGSSLEARPSRTKE